MALSTYLAFLQPLLESFASALVTFASLPELATLAALALVLEPELIANASRIVIIVVVVNLIVALVHFDRRVDGFSVAVMN